jgi:hypothetical protein
VRGKNEIASKATEPMTTFVLFTPHFKLKLRMTEQRRLLPRFDSSSVERVVRVVSKCILY